MPEGNSAIVERFEKAFAANDVATLDALSDPGLVDHNPVPGHPPTLSGFKQAVAMYKKAFPDSQVDLHAIVEQKDVVATHWTVSGTHRGELLGIAATGKRVTVEGMNFYRLRGGKITDVWTQFDGLSLMQQLGALPG
jgi:steroid delta-isomerase-like uncharacterized protein